MSKPIQTLLDDIRLLGNMQLEVIEAVRALVRRTIVPLEEEVKYGGIVFASGVPFGGVFAYKEHVTFEFSCGADMDDPEGFLEGAGKGRRHIKLRSVGDITGKQLTAYLPRALVAATLTSK